MHLSSGDIDLDLYTVDGPNVESTLHKQAVCGGSQHTLEEVAIPERCAGALVFVTGYPSIGEWSGEC